MTVLDLETAADQASEAAPALAIADLRHRYGDRLALDGVGFTLGPGELAILLGPNGAGKTTLFSLITRLYDRQSGAIAVFGSDLRHDPTTALSKIGVVFQQRTLDLDLTVLQNLRYAAALHGLPRAEARSRVCLGVVGPRPRPRPGNRRPTPPP